MNFFPRLTISLALALCACADRERATPASVVAAERAFAQDGYEFGVKASFLKHSADDAIVLQPDPVSAHEKLNASPDPAPGEAAPKLIWWPLFAGVARSGDLGFTTGPYEFDGARRGHYFTVWKKQSDGSWKWIFDGGVGADPTGEEGPEGAVAFLPVARRGAGSPEKAIEQVEAAEAELARASSSDAVAALIAYLAADARVHSQGPPPAKSAAQFAAVLAARAPQIEFSRRGGAASSAGDLVWTYGDARWTTDGVSGRGHYVRIWQARAEGWRIVFDELVPRNGPAE